MPARRPIIAAMNHAPHDIAVFELSSSPHGQLISFETPPALSITLASLGVVQGSCWIDGLDLACSVGEFEARFVGAGRFCANWSAQPLPTYLCAFHPDFPDGALAMALRWGPTG